jgi:RNA polymerase subunit RPABC4/transcription elongation factor Spt4
MPTLRDLWLPLLIIVLVTLSFLAAAGWVVYRLIQDGRANERHKRATIRLCSHCGYDLRASQDLCPECGMKQPYCVNCGNRVFRAGDRECPCCHAPVELPEWMRQG